MKACFRDLTNILQKCRSGLRSSLIQRTEDGMSAMDTTTNGGGDVATWPQLAEGLYGFLTGRGATIEYAFDRMEILVPRDTGADAPQARWGVSGTRRIRTSETGQA